MQEQPLALPYAPKSRAWLTTAFGKLLQEHRSRAGYSQAYLAKKTHFSSETIGALERGTRRAPHAGALELLIDALGLIGDERLAFEEAAAVARTKSSARKAGERPRTHLLPAQLTPLVGRDEEIGKLNALIATQRLVTVTGFSGIGKTRVALEIATRYSHGTAAEVWMVDLEALERNGSVPDKVASVIGVSPTRRSSSADLSAVLGSRKGLLILDSCEHVISETSETALALIRGCPGMKFLVASSERLGVPGETVLRLPSLSLPDHVPASLEEARRYSAIALFIDRAEAETAAPVRVEKLQTIVEICRRLDGIPRAIELAAARLAALGLESLLLRLDERHVLSGGGRDLPARKQEPREAVGWSYAGLPSLEQALFRRLAIFTANHTLEDAEAVCTDDAIERARLADVLDSLVHKSLVVVERSNGTVRYRLLEIARAFGLRKLIECGEFERYSERHARWFAAAFRHAGDDARP